MLACRRASRAGPMFSWAIGETSTICRSDSSWRQLGLLVGRADPSCCGRWSSRRSSAGRSESLPDPPRTWPGQPVPANDSLKPKKASSTFGLWSARVWPWSRKSFDRGRRLNLVRRPAQVRARPGPCSGNRLCSSVSKWPKYCIRSASVLPTRTIRSLFCSDRVGSAAGAKATPAASSKTAVIEANRRGSWKVSDKESHLKLRKRSWGLAALDPRHPCHSGTSPPFQTACRSWPGSLRGRGGA